MRALLTGATSFTGAWFAQALAEEGWAVVAALRGDDEDPAAATPRARRLALVRRRLERIAPRAPFGSANFLAAIAAAAPLDLLCHHGAEVGDHRRPDYDANAAAAANAFRLETVLDVAEAAGCRAVLLTGTVFEADEGEGDPPLRAFNAYGLAKTLTWHRFRFAAERRGLALGKLVVPAPFGPLEKEGFPARLVRSWLRGEEPIVRHPHLVRDHVPVLFLARAYARLADELARGGAARTLRSTPSGFALPLARFADRLADAMRPRLRRACRFGVAVPPDPADEPLVRRNTEPMPELGDARLEAAMWDAYATAWLKGNGAPAP